MKQRPLLPTSLIALSVFISACAPMQNSANGPSFGSGSLTVKQDGQPANAISNLATVNWNAMTESILTPAAKKQGVEVNRVHDGSLRVLLPAKTLFSARSNNITRQMAPVLKTIAEEMKIRQMLRVKVVGHTDSSGGTKTNQNTSLNRAYTVAQRLINDGVSSSRIDIEGRGSIDPLVANDTAERRTVNRRVELYLYQLKQ